MIDKYAEELAKDIVSGMSLPVGLVRDNVVGITASISRHYASAMAQKRLMFEERQELRDILKKAIPQPKTDGTCVGYDPSPLEMVKIVLAENEQMKADIAAAAGECLVEIPEPGTDLAKVLIANRLLRIENNVLKQKLYGAYGREHIYMGDY